MLEVTTTGLVYHCNQYGVTLIIPEGAVKDTATIWCGIGLFSNKSRYEENFIPVSPTVWIFINNQLIKPAELYIPHHIDVSNVEDCNQFLLLSADDESFIKDKVFNFKQNHENEITIKSNLVKILTSHFCSYCIASKGVTYNELPKRYLIARADKRKDDTLFIDYIFLYQEIGCVQVSVITNIFLLVESL